MLYNIEKNHVRLLIISTYPKYFPSIFFDYSKLFEPVTQIIQLLDLREKRNKKFQISDLIFYFSVSHLIEMYRKKNCPKEFPFLLSKFRALKKKASGHSTKSGLIKQRAENENHLSADHIATSPLPPMPPAGDKRAIYPEEQGIENGTSQEYDNRAAKFSVPFPLSSANSQ